jgi:mono/diheme cytochrome c family protein
MWAVHLISGLGPGSAREFLDHRDPAVRLWTLRLAETVQPLPPSFRQRLVAMAAAERDAEVRSELAHTTARLDTATALAVLGGLIGRREDTADRYIPLRIWWALEAQITRDADAVLDWVEMADVWQAPLFAEHLAGRIARRLAAERGDAASFTRLDPDTDWLSYAAHPRSRMPGGKGDYTDWATNETRAISDRSLTRLARLLAMAPSAADRERLLAGANTAFGEGAPVQHVPEPLAAIVTAWWASEPHASALVDVAAHLGHPEAVQVRAGAASRRGLARGRATAAATNEAGRDAFLTYCAPCHQTDGTGLPRLGAPLRNSPWVLGDDAALIRIVLHGLQGELLMPPMGTLDDQQLAAILTYIRGAWGHAAGPVSADAVAAVRRASAARTTPWTRAELSAVAATP